MSTRLALSPRVGTAASSVLVLWLVAGCLPGFDDPDYMTPPPFADPQAGCASGCHGGEASNAPPNSLSGVTETTSVGVGAHQKHLDPASTWHRPVACADCHVVPADVGSPGWTTARGPRGFDETR